MMLYVLRHGVAEEVGPEGTDGSRPAGGSCARWRPACVAWASPSTRS